MKTLLAACALLFTVATATTAAATAEYYGIDQFMGGDVILDLDYWDPNFVVGPDYHVHRLDWSIENTGPNSYYDVWLVLPFAWLQVDGVLRAYSFDDVTNEWYWTDGVDHFYLASDTTAYIPPPADVEFKEYELLREPLCECDLSGVAAVICEADTPIWTCAELNPLDPGETLTFTMYLRQQTDSRVSGLWLQPYTVAAIPEPSTVLLVGVGLGALLLRRRKR